MCSQPGCSVLCLKSFVCVCVAVMCLCCPVFAAPSQVRVPAQTAETRAVEPSRRLAYRFDFEHPGRVHVTLETSSPATGVELLELPSTWADARELERAIENLKITGSEVSLEPAGRPSRLSLRAKPGTTMQLEYDLVQDWTGPFRAAERHRVLVGPDLVLFNGENGLVAPKMDAGAAVQVRFDFVHLPAGQTPVTSFGMEAHQAMRGAWSGAAGCGGALEFLRAGACAEGARNPWCGTGVLADAGALLVRGCANAVWNRDVGRRRIGIHPCLQSDACAGGATWPGDRVALCA